MILQRAETGSMKSKGSFDCTVARIEGLQMSQRVALSKGFLHINKGQLLYLVCLKSSVNGTRKQTKQKIQTN
jgi:hypothetical protein